jgi:DNA-binding transcriptional ArsR family regulator
VSDIFDALAAPARRAILDELNERNGQTLSELCTRLTMKHGFGLSRQAILQNLEVLASVGLVTSKRQGRCKFHHLDTTPLKAIVERWSQSRIERSQAMRIHLANVFVDDQHKALKFYTEVLGFLKKDDVPVGEARWLTVVSPHDPEGTELLLEPDGHPAVKPFKRALVDDGIPFTSFAVDDAHSEYERLQALGVRFTQEPAEMGPVTTAVLDDTCGNLIQIASRN